MGVLVVDRVMGGTSSELAPYLQGSAEEEWTIIVDSPNYTAELLRAEGIFPVPYFSFHPANPWLILKPIKIKQSEEAPELFHATLTYDSEPVKQKDKEKSEYPNPLLRPAQIRWRTDYEEEAAQLNRKGKAILNSAGEYFDPPLSRKRRFLTACVTKNVAGFPDWAWDLIGCVNSSAYTLDGRTIPIGRSMLDNIELAAWAEEGNPDDPGGVIQYRAATFEIAIKRPRDARDEEDEDDIPSPWQLEVLDQGLHEKRAGKLIRIKDQASPPQDIAAPVCLDGAGRRLNNPTPASAVYIVDDDFEFWANLSALPLT